MNSPCSPSVRPASFPGTLCAPATPWRSLRGGGARGPGGASQRLPRRFELCASEVRWFSRSCVRGFHDAACAVLGFRAQRSRAAPWPGVAKYSCDLVVSRCPLTGSRLAWCLGAQFVAPGRFVVFEAKSERRVPKALLPPGRWSPSYSSRASVLKTKYCIKPWTLSQAGKPVSSGEYRVLVLPLLRAQLERFFSLPSRLEDTVVRALR